MVTRSYLRAVKEALDDDIDDAQLLKLYGEAAENAGRYSPGVCNGAEKEPVTGSPDQDHMSTSYVERQNLAMRMQRRSKITSTCQRKVEISPREGLFEEGG
jgi:hypothetical protein